MVHLVIAIIDGTQTIRLMLGWSPEDVELRARYFWRDNVITSVEVHQAIDITIPEGWQP
tara:strand:- start:801 stop:977 length:177 start_codon:yes stop_codon:yes gene_type:complete